ncbi:MAG: hypothetical protein ACIALR_04360, partial [Blastopirellula sp. JB062]
MRPSLLNITLAFLFFFCSLGFAQPPAGKKDKSSEPPADVSPSAPAKPAGDATQTDKNEEATAETAMSVDEIRRLIAKLD